MSKFKVGDKVINICKCDYCNSKGYYNKIFTIESVYDNNYILKEVYDGGVFEWNGSVLKLAEIIPEEMFEL